MLQFHNKPAKRGDLTMIYETSTGKYKAIGNHTRIENVGSRLYPRFREWLALSNGFVLSVSNDAICGTANLMSTSEGLSVTCHRYKVLLANRMALDGGYPWSKINYETDADIFRGIQSSTLGASNPVFYWSVLLS